MCDEAAHLGRELLFIETRIALLLRQQPANLLGHKKLFKRLVNKAVVAIGVPIKERAGAYLVVQGVQVLLCKDLVLEELPDRELAMMNPWRALCPHLHCELRHE